MEKYDSKTRGAYGLIGFMVGILLLLAVSDYQSSMRNISLIDFLNTSENFKMFFALIVLIPTISGMLIGSARTKIHRLRSRLAAIKEEKEKLANIQNQAQSKTAELRGLLDQESGLFIDNWGELVNEKERLREEAEISSALVDIALAVGGLAGEEDVLELLRKAVPSALFADDCRTFIWDDRARVFVGKDAKLKLRPRSVKTVGSLRLNKEPVAVENLADNLARSDTADELGARSAILIPCLRGDKTYAILVALYKSSRKFNPRDLRLAAGISNQARIVFDNAHLYEEVVDKRNELQKLLTRLASTQEEERRRISRDLHDGVIQNLSGIIFSLNFLGQALGEEQKGALEEVGQLENIVNETITDLRKVIYNLRPTILDSLGLVPTLEKHLDQFGEANGIEIEYEPKLSGRLDEKIETGLFRLAQETLNNIKKHAQAKKVTLALRKSKINVIMTVKDDGKGFDIKKAGKRASQSSGFGLSGMSERAESLGGTVRISSKPGMGTEIKVTVPYKAKGT